MAIINDNFTLRAPVPYDDRKGWWDDSTGEWKPFNDVQHALDTVVYYRYRTLTLPVVDGGDVVEYWFKEGVEDSDFVMKNTAADLSNYYTKSETDLLLDGKVDNSTLLNYYTKTELQTSGQSQVHWDNLINVPSIQSPLTFENGLREDGGVVKLGLDLTTIGSTNLGILSEQTLLINGDILTFNARYLEISDIRVVNYASDGITSSFLELQPDRLHLGISNTPGSIGTPDYGFDINPSGIIVYDSNGGARDADDYSANKTQYSYVTKMMLDAVAATIPSAQSLQQVTDVGSSTDNLIYAVNGSDTFGAIGTSEISRGEYAMSILGNNLSVDSESILLKDGNVLINGVDNISLTTLAFDFRSGAAGTFAAQLRTNMLTNEARQYEFPDASGTIALVSDIPDLTGYATETWVTSQGYLTSVPWSFNVNNGDLTINGVTNNLDGRWLERAEGVITQGYGITVNGDLATGMGIELDTTVVDNRYLRKDINDSNDSFSLTLGGLTSGDAVFTESVTLETVGTGTGDEVLLYGPGGVIQRKTLTVDGQWGVANAGGTKQFDVALGTNLRIAGDGDTSVSFNSSTNTVTITSIPGSGTGGVITSVFGRTTSAIVAETGDYNTSQVTESGNLYFTEARARGTDLAGFTVGSNAAISATDTVLSAFGKTQGQINARVPTSRTISISGTSGNITVSGGTTQNLGSNVAWTINLPNKGTAGTYTKVVTDAQGRVASGGSLTTGDLPSSVIQTLSTGSSTSMGYLSISDGNTVYQSSLGQAAMLNASVNDVYFNQTYFQPYRMSSSDVWSSTVVSAIRSIRQSNASASFGWDLGMAFTSSDQYKLQYRRFVNDTWSSLYPIASEDWVSDNFVNTTGNQNGIQGSKEWTGNAHIWSPSSTFAAKSKSIQIAAGSSGAWLQGYKNSSTEASFLLRGYEVNGVQLELNEGGINFLSQNLLYYNGDRVLSVGANTNLSGPTTGSSVYLRPNGTGSSTGQAIFAPSSITLDALTGSGTQMVTVNASGVLGRQAIPAVGVTSIAAGNGMNFTTITGTGSVTLGTPGTLSPTTTNSVSATSHTHALADTVLQSHGNSLSGDLNSVSWNGTQSVGTAANATLALNYPVAGGGGTLLNLHNGTYVTQLFHNRNGSYLGWRARTSVSAWTSWEQIYHTGNFNPSNYVTTNTNQTGLSGNKTTSGTWSFSGDTSVPLIISRTNTDANSSIRYSTQNSDVYAGIGAASTFSIGYTANLQADSWFNVSASGMTYASPNTASATVPANGIVFSRNSNGPYIQSNGASSTSWVLRGYATSGVQLALNDGGVDIPTGTSNTTSGYYIGGNVVLGASSNYALLSAPTTSGIVYLYPNGRGSATGRWIITPTDVTISSLTGSGTQMVVVNAAGELSRQTINSHTHTWSQLSGGSTGLIPGAGSTGTYGSLDISGSKGTFSGIRFTDAPNNSTFMIHNTEGRSGVWAGGWIWQWNADGSLATGTVPWSNISGQVSVTAGNGLTGGGVLTASRSLTLGTPGSITLSSTNSVSTSSHTHAFAPGGTTSQYIRGDGSLATFPSIPSGDITGVTAGNGLTGGGTSGTVTLAVGAGSGISVGTTTVAVDSTVIRTTGNQSKSGVLTLSNELIAHSVRLDTAASSGTTINMATVGLLRLSSISSSTTYTLSNNADGRQVQCIVTNTNSSNNVTVTVTGATLLGSNIVQSQQQAVISIINFGDGRTVYTVVSGL